jgi:hypothetical protein
VMDSWLAAEERGETQLRAVRASSIRLRQALTRVEQGVAKKVRASCLASLCLTPYLVRHRCFRLTKLSHVVLLM